MLKFLLSLFVSVHFLQTTGQYTEIQIVGTIHPGNKKFNHRTLLRKIKTLKPDIILWEQSTPFKRVFGLLTARTLRIWKPGIEQLALQRYSRQNRLCPILPYDFDIPHRKQYLREMTGQYSALYGQLDTVKMTEADSIRYATFSQLRARYFHDIFEMTLEEINEPGTWRKAGDLFTAESTGLAELVKKYTADSSLVNWHQRECNFWIQRNEFMADRILQHAKANPGKKILVLTGLNHKYYLMKKMKEQSGSAILLLE